ncbi:anion exchange protein 2-like isoform X2 [Mya arenaria]|uniref:anion exchange protein 2-like isoform X2 n=1 Tax=Mya arenaria TaxID=6604 RepID=UPI0022DECE74|nr:anion exchange protein 2-like isoform X2 [Mya arenaria]
MSYFTRANSGSFENVDDDDDNFGFQATVDFDCNTDGLPRSPTEAESLSSMSSDYSVDSRPRSVRSASIAVSPSETGLSFWLDMDQEDDLEHSFSLHDDIEKLFDKPPERTFADLLSCSEDSVPWGERHQEVIEIPSQGSERCLEEYDITSHRRSSFPHIHVPLKSLHSHSSKNFAAPIEQVDDEEKEPGIKKKKKKRKKSRQHVKKSKSNVFPSKTATVSASIPEVEREEYSAYNTEFQRQRVVSFSDKLDLVPLFYMESDGSKSNDDSCEDEDDLEIDETTKLLDDAGLGNLITLTDDELDAPLEPINELYISETDLSAKPIEITVSEADKLGQPITGSVKGQSQPISESVTLEVVNEATEKLDKSSSAHLRLPWTIGDTGSTTSSLVQEDTTLSVPSFSIENAHLRVPWLAPKKTPEHGLFYIGSDNQVGSSASSVAPNVSPSISTVQSSVNFPGLADSSPVVVVLNNDENRPLVSTSLQRSDPPKTMGNVKFLMEQDDNKVKFLLGEEIEGSDVFEVKAKFGNNESDDDDSSGDSDDSSGSGSQEEDDDDHHQQQNKLSSNNHQSRDYDRGHSHPRVAFERQASDGGHSTDEEGRRTSGKGSMSPKSRSKHRRHHHHENYKTEDLMRRRQRGSEVQITDALRRVPTVTETEEAITLQSADLEEMASHRMDDLQGIRKHKIGHRKHKGSSTKVYHGKGDKPRRKYMTFSQKKKTFDHSPHEVFVELDELYSQDGHEIEWREKARWIKFEEDVEEGAERWGKPHVASLSFHSLLELRKGLEKGSLLLDLEASELIEVAQRIVEDMVIHDQITSDVKGHVMRTILTKHKFVTMDTVKTLLARNKSSMDLQSMEERHQKDVGQHSLMKTLSQSSFSQLPSESHIQASANNSVNRHSGMNLTVPETNHFGGKLGSQTSLGKNSKKKDKKERDKDSKQNGVHRPGRLEMVKVDIDKTMSSGDAGMHIGVVPKEADLKDPRSDHKMSLMRRIQRDAEACMVLVGVVDYLSKPAMAFVRLAEKQVMENLTEVPLPVRFIFVLLGPPNSSMDYHEIGRSISTLMSNQHFHEIAYKSESRSDILHAINEFLNESIVLPPGDWDQKTLLPVMDMARKKAKIRRRHEKKKKELEELQKIEIEKKIPMDPLKRTGRPFGGLFNDIRRRFPHYKSDFQDGFDPQCIMALIFIFFACLCPCIAFGGLYGEKTHGEIGVVETIIATACTNLLFALFSGQPLILYGATGPVLVFEKHLWKFCYTSGIEFLTWRVWIGIWVFVITAIVIALEGSYIVKSITRFTEEVFAILISLIFINEVIQKLIEIYQQHPLRGKEYYCDINSETNNTENVTAIINNVTATTILPVLLAAKNMSSEITYSVSTVTGTTTDGHHDGKNHDGVTHGYSGHYGQDSNINEPNTALLSTILILGTFLIAYFLRIFRNSKFLGRSARRALGDFGIFLAIVLMVLFDYICADTFTQKLALPTTTFSHTTGQETWFVNPMGQTQTMTPGLMVVAVIPAFLIFLLLFLESQLTQMLLHKNEFMLKKGTGFHLDQFILGVVILLCSIFGLPWMCPATVRSVAHVSSLAVMSRTHAPGEKPKLLGVKDQRVTNIVMNILIASTLAWGDVLRAVPMAVLFGVLLYLGVSAISGVQLFKRIRLLFMPVKHHPGKSYVRHVKTMKMHIFTIIQVILVGILWAVKSTVVAIAFPLFVFLMVPLRLKILPKFFTHEELEVLDKEEEDSDDEEDTDPDFYQLAHMPI